MSEMHEHKSKHDEDVIVKAKRFFLKYEKPLLTAAIAIIVVVGGWLAYQNFIVAPKEHISMPFCFCIDFLVILLTMA